MKKKFLMWALVACLVPGGESLAQSYPDAPIRLIVPYAPGGSTDLLARLIAKKLSTQLPGNVIVENHDGAGGNIAASFVARSQPNGYTLMMASIGQFAINPLIFSKPGYDATKDFTAVASIAEVPNVLVANVTGPLNSIQSVIDEARQNPGQLSFASSGNGSSNHLAGVLFSNMAGIKLIHVPYKGSAPGLQALFSNVVTTMFDNLSSSLPYIRSGKLRALGVTSLARVPQLPEVPTIAETGLAGYEASAWFGIVAPSGTPVSITELLNNRINEILKEGSFRNQLIDMGMTPIPDSRAGFEKRIRTDMIKWKPVVDNAHLAVN